MITRRREATASLPPDPISARHARRFLRTFLDSAHREDLRDNAELALSEVVTNAVLHAHTDLQVTVLLDDVGALRVDVADHNPQLPVQRRYSAQATTGRGMELVAALTTDCGVESHGHRGKTVWFVLAPEGGGSQEHAAPDAWDIDPRDAAQSGGGTVTVVLQGLPSALWLAARQHHDAIVRELVLYAAEHPADAPPPDRVAVADQARGWISTHLVAELDRRARAAGRITEMASTGLPRWPADLLAAMDVEVAVPEGASQAFAVLQDVLDAAERLAIAGRLLSRPGLPEVVAVRDWACEQAISQLAGVSPSPWSGTGQERFTVDVRDRAHPDRPDWDASVVVEASRGAVAADDANRIIAVSRPLAAALGWTVEDLVGRRITAVIPPELREAHVAGFTRHLTTGETHLLGTPLRLPALRADGTRVECDVLIERAPVTAGRPVYLAWIDPVA